ncbi:hypothetical protein [Cupriavidus consociatus]|uniref:hypothetical protein n=1 Tax=Cupriavidus consociatus TaxID=2821357 RepID=UPI001AE2D1A2|nr:MULTISPECIES: hypothetical protein [unclassified Cupriavidus]MBP0624979.1 hypothetical protein [Cupriavidus sp. LEh25]MDK2661711.1 hypothetical protein [Cupriavidus sp. LEh21]
MAPTLRIVVRMLGIGAILVIIAVVSRQVYLQFAAQADLADAEEAPAERMLIRCETLHRRLQNRHRRADTEANDALPRVRCRES